MNCPRKQKHHPGIALLLWVFTGSIAGPLSNTATAATALTASTDTTTAPHPTPIEDAMARPTTPASTPERAADAELERARTAAAADRHEAALLYYRRALRERPALASELGKEIGNQYTWADKPDSAIVWYRRYLNVHPGEVDAQLGLARALSWTDRDNEALAIYRSVLPRAVDRRAEVYTSMARVTSWKDQNAQALVLYDSALAIDPENVDAQTGRAQVLNWSGKHRAAASLYRGLLTAHPRNTDIIGGLANAYVWMDRPDRARKTLRGASLDKSLREIRAGIARDRAPALEYTYAHNTDSDNIERNRQSVETSIMPGMLTALRFRYDHWTIEQPALPPIARDQARGGIRVRLSDALAVNASTGYEWNSFRAAPAQPFTSRKDFNLLLVDAYATITPGDWVRSDLGVSRGSIENPEPIFRAIAYTDYTAGLDWRLTPTWLTVSSASFTDYNDGNTKVAATMRAVYSPSWRAPISIRNRWKLYTSAGYLSFSQTPDNGYYDPGHYLTAYERVEVTLSLSHRMELLLGGRIGTEKENSDNWFSTGAIDGRARFIIANGLTLTAGYFNTQSRLDTRAGYQANGWYVTAGAHLSGKGGE